MGVGMRGSVLRVAAAIALLVTASCTSGSGSATAPSTAVPAPAEEMTTYLDNLVRGHQFRGVVEVRLGDRMLLGKAFGQADVANDVPAEPDTRYRIGSLTKQFTALLVLVLQEQGRLQVADPVCAHLPTCPAAWRAITVEQLLTHTAGLYDYVQLSGGDPERYATVFGPSPTPEDLIETFADRPLEFAPGSRFRYSSSGYVLLGYLVEQLSGQPYGRFLKDRILGPLGMTDTAYEPGAQPTDRDAVGYRAWTTPAPKAPDSVSFSGGGIVSTAADLTRWNRFLLTGEPAVVEKDTLAQLLKPRVAADNGGRYGYGIYTIGTGDAAVHGHPGAVPGFVAYNEVRPADDLSVVVLSNLDTANAFRIGRNLDAFARG
jgi:CubicO group peptidase (beta-lactamase class C family)